MVSVSASIQLFRKSVLKVGYIQSCKALETSDKLYQLEVDLNEGSSRQIMTGLKQIISIDEIISSKVIIYSNLKPRKIAGEISNGMLLCAYDDNDKFDILRPDQQSKIGEQVYLEGIEREETENKIVNPKQMLKYLDRLSTSADLGVQFEGEDGKQHVMRTDSGRLYVNELRNCKID